eukprot:PITA_14713
MNKSEIVTPYLTRVQQTHDELLAVGEAVSDSELVKEWWWGEELALAVEVKKGKGKAKQNQDRGGSSQGKKEKDMSKVKCFACCKFDHFAGQCPNRKKGKGKTSTRMTKQMDELVEKFERNFALVSCLFGTVTRRVWFLDSGVSCHMMRSRDIFSNMAKELRDLHVELGDNTKYATEGIDNIDFQLDSRNIMEVNLVMFVPRLEKNLLLVMAMEDRRLEVSFMGGKVAIRSKGADPNKRRVIGSRENDLYLLRGQPVKALLHESDSQSELWHKRMGHLHYRALPMLWRMVTGFLEIRVE